MANLKTVSELKDSVAGILSGLNINTVSDLNATLERAVSNFLQKADVPEAIQTQAITLYNGVYDYLCDPRIYGTDLIDIAPQGVSRTMWDYATKTGLSQFDRTKGYLPSGSMATFQYMNGVPVIRVVAKNTIPNANIDPCTSVGNWVAGGSATGLTVDNSIYYQTPASLRFTLTGSSAGTLTETLNSELGLSTYQGVGVAFLAVYIPDADTLTSISLKLGSDNSNYSTVTATQLFLGAWTSNSWQLVAFDFANSTDTGTPDWSAIDYVQITFNHTATQTNFRIGDLFMSLPSANTIFFQSAAVFQATGTETLSQTITANTDTIIFNTPAYTIYLYESALAVLENTGGAAGDAMYDRITRKLGIDPATGKIVGGLYSQFLGNNPSQQLRQLGSYYDNTRNWGWGNGAPGGF